MLAELGFKLTTPGLTAQVATDWATGPQQVRRGLSLWYITASTTIIEHLQSKDYMFADLLAGMLRYNPGQ